MNNLTSQSCDVLVIGGGPGGSTISSLLAEKGWHVVLLDKDVHPRFHIGESLLPMNMQIFEKMGIMDGIANIGIVKPGAEFISMHGDRQVFHFDLAIDHQHSTAFQVKRGEFDHLLLKNSQQKGTDVHQGVRVTDVNFNDKENILVLAESNQGEQLKWQCRYVVDASGRDTFLAKQFGIKQRNLKHQSAAVFGHYKNVEKRTGKEAGIISLYWFDYGWVWLIPLSDDVMSVGAVCWPDYLKTRRCSNAEFLQQTIDKQPYVKERMQGAELVSDVYVTGNFSYSAKNLAGENYLMIGDAFAFIDPVFSSGVYLAMDNGIHAAEVVDITLKKEKNAKKLLRSYQKRVKRGLSIFSWFIYRVATPSMRSLLLAPQNYFRMEEGVASILAGDVYDNKKARRAVFFFKVMYYVFSLRKISGSWTALIRRRINAKTEFQNTEKL